MAKRKTRNAAEIVDQMVGGDEELRGAVEEESTNSSVASMLFKPRRKAGLTQQQLADLAGTAQSVIARLESADYEGHSLSMLVRLAAALDNRIEISLVPKGGNRHSA